MWEATYIEWKKALDEAKIDEDTILAGLSAGGAACIRYMAVEKKTIDKLILIAPAALTEKEYLLIDDNTKNQIKNGTTIFVSDDEPYVDIQDAVKVYEKKFDAKVIRFSDRGHFSFLIKTFPELLEEILKNK